MESLYAETGLPVVAHNRFWATDTVYSTHNGGQVAQKYFKNKLHIFVTSTCLQFNFITETATNRSLPQDAEFWDQLFAEAVRWGLEVYEQDWQDRWELRSGE